ncbi:MAG: sensor histidine kinase, partial [Cytophagia bacterium]
TLLKMIGGDNEAEVLQALKKIVEKHKGKIYFKSEEGVGTTFFVEIPATQEIDH